MARLVSPVTMMHFKAFAAAFLLAGSAVAVPAGEVFETNRADILARSVSVIGETVFSVGKAKSSEKAGTAVGFSKAAVLACGNLDRLNYDRAQWPSDIAVGEKSIVWKLYRADHPFVVKVEGGFRVFEEKTASENYLVVMAFPKSQVLLPPVSESALRKILAKVRAKVAAQAAPLVTNAVESSSPSVQSPGPVQASPTIQEMETLDEDMML